MLYLKPFPISAFKQESFQIFSVATSTVVLIANSDKQTGATLVYPFFAKL